MENIFKNAYFGKAYKARNGKKAIYLGYTNNSIYHICFIEGESNKTLYFNNGDAWGHQRKGNNVDDIVSEWKDEIDEEELEDIAIDEGHELSRKYGYDNSLEDENIFIDGFKEGYRKAKEI